MFMYREFLSSLDKAMQNGFHHLSLHNGVIQSSVSSLATEKTLYLSMCIHIYIYIMLALYFNIAYACLFMFLQGTTGSPKAALISHHSLVNCMYFIGKKLEFNMKVCVLSLGLPVNLQSQVFCWQYLFSYQPAQNCLLFSK